MRLEEGMIPILNEDDSSSEEMLNYSFSIDENEDFNLSSFLQGGSFFEDWNYPKHFKTSLKKSRSNPLRNMALKRKRQAFKYSGRGKLVGVQHRYRKLFFHNGKFDNNERRFIEAGLNAKKRIDTQPNCDTSYVHIQFWRSKNDVTIKRLMEKLSSSKFYSYESENGGNLDITSSQWKSFVNDDGM